LKSSQPIDWVFLFNSFDGRISRKLFWMAMGVLIVAELIGNFAAAAIGGDRLTAIIDLAFTYPEFAVAVKRGHDRSTPLWLLVAFFGANALLDLLTVLGFAGTGEEPTMASLLIAVPFAILGVALLVELGFRKGTPGPNQYGPDPLSKV